jgi:hypothetical protein
MSNADIVRQRAKGAIFVLVLLAAPMADIATAQARPLRRSSRLGGSDLLMTGLLARAWSEAPPGGICSLESVSDRNLCTYTDQTTVTW